MATIVKFLLDSDGDTFAYFPQLNADNSGNKTSYAHIGQHSACSNDYAKECASATKEQYTDLLNELTSIGYDCKVLNKS